MAMEKLLMANAKIQQTLVCANSADFNEVGGDPILPFLFALNILDSNLEPGPGENQRFCYDIIGNGLDNSDYADLSHFVFEICDEIPLAQITNVTVVIDGVEQTVIIGDNVELFVPPNVDPPTGCPGLKFDFGLDKVEGEMQVCFELTETYPIGPVPICLFGAGETREGLSICGPVCEAIEDDCLATAFQRMDICVPVTVTPFATPLPTTTVCCGPPTIAPILPGSTPCPGIENGSCSFTITQSICVEVPVEFGADPVVGNLFVECGELSDEDICTNCGIVNGGE